MSGLRSHSREKQHMMGTSHYALACPVCDDAVSGQYVDSLDGEAHPEQLRDLLRGRLNVVTCPTCGHSGLVPEPLLVRLPSRNRLVGFMPVEVPTNRKAHLARRLKARLAASAGRTDTVAVCFGARQLQQALPEFPWPKIAHEFRHRFDQPGSARHRQTALRRALKRRPDDALVLTRLGIALYDEERLRSARAVLEQALSINPNLAQALHCLGSVSLDEGKPAEALELYDRVVSMTRDALPRFLAGVAAYRAGRTSAALERLTQAVRQSPSLLEAHVWLAIVHLSRDDRRAALAALTRAIEQGLSDPDLVLSHAEFDALRSDRTFRSLVNLMRKIGVRNGRTRRRPDHRVDDRSKRRGTRPARSGPR